MGLKSISLVLFGLALCCLLQSTAASRACKLKLWISPRYPDIYTIKSGEGSFSSPFQGGEAGSTWPDLVSFTALVKMSSYCDYCTMKVFEGKNFNGTSQVIDFRTSVGDDSQITWSVPTYSYTLECFPPDSSGYEEEEEEEEEEEQIDYVEEEYFEEECCEEEIEYIEEEEEEDDLSGYYSDAVFQQMNEGDGSTLPHQLVELRHKAVQKAIDRLINRDILPSNQHTPERVFATEFCTNYEDIYRFNVQVRDTTGAEFRIWFSTISWTHDHEVYQLVDAGYKENRIGEFAQTDFKELPPADSQVPYPEEIENLRTKSLEQAVDRLQTKGILPAANYSLYETSTVEYSAVVNMTEYPHPEDMLYRFNTKVEDAAGALFRISAIIATNYETPEFYELIDYGYKKIRISEFSDIEWRELNEREDLPLPAGIVQMRNRSIAQAIPRLQAEGILPVGKYSVAKTFATEISDYFNSPYFSPNRDYLYRFNVQLTNEAGARFRVAVVIVTDDMLQPRYELIDYSHVENRLDEFTNTKFVSLNEGDLQTKSINQAVEKLQSKSVLPQGKYTIAKTFPTAFSPKFEHPDYSTDDYILYKFTAQVNNAAGTGVKVYAIVIASYNTPEDFEVIDYGKINNA